MTKRGDLTESARAYLAEIGRRGGLVTGKAKRRGGPEHYAKVARARWGKADSGRTR